MKTEKNKIFLDINQHLPVRLTKDGKGGCRDGSAFPFIIEQFIAVAVTDVYLPDFYEKYSRYSPTFIDKRIKYINTKNAVVRASAVLKPILDEFQVFPGENGIGLIVENSNVDRRIRADIKTLVDGLIDFFCAAEHRLFVDIDITKILTSILKLRMVVREPNARMSLACLNGLFLSYKKEEVESLILLPPSSNRHVSMFLEFVEDTVYQELSATANSAGYPRLSMKAIPKMRRLAKQVASHPPFKQITELSLKALSVVTGVPALSAESIAEAIQTDFLPPITSFQPEISRGLEYWYLIEPDFYSPGANKDDYEDWKSIKKDFSPFDPGLNNNMKLLRAILNKLDSTKS